MPCASPEELRGCCLSAADLVPFLRRPLLLVVDSDNAHAFASVPSLAQPFSQPVLCLLAPGPSAPTHVDARAHGRLAGGGALTLFLHEPIAALCALCDLRELSRAQYELAASELATSIATLTSSILERPHTPAAALAFAADPFMRMLIVRFALCEAAFYAHRRTRRLIACGELLAPRCEPPLSIDATRLGAALDVCRKLALAIGAADQFEFGECEAAAAS